MENTKNELYAALNAAIDDLSVVVKDASGYKYKYASMHSVLKVVNPVLKQHNLAIYHVMQQDDHGVYLKSVLVHVKGSTIESRMPLMFKPGDMKELGAALTYARRYAVQAFLNLAFADGDLDEQQEPAPKLQKPVAKIGPTQMQILSESISDDEVLARLLDEFKVPSIADLPVTMYKIALNRAKELEEVKYA